MKLAHTLLENERKQQPQKNFKEIRMRLKELVYAYPEQVIEVMHRTGVPVSTVIPPVILLTVLVKHLTTNSELRETIAKMLLEMDGYSAADGSTWSTIGGALSAVGSVLSGIGRSQSEQSVSDAQLREIEKQKELEEEKQRSRRKTIWMIIGISAVVLTAIVIIVRLQRKAKLTPKPAAL